MKAPSEFRTEIGERIRSRRLSLSLTQQDAALRAGIAYRTWRRLEVEGHASIEDLIKAAVALRCEEGLDGLFPEPVASSLDELLDRQAVQKPTRMRAPSRSQRA